MAFRAKIHKLICIVLCMCMVIPLSACGEGKAYQKQVFAMDTVMTLTAYGKNGSRGINAADSIILALDTLADPDNESGTAYALNHANGEEVVVTGQIADMLITAIDVYEKSGGSYDLTIYPLVKRWGFTDGKYYVPSDEEILEDLARLCMGEITVSKFPTSGTYSVQMPSYGELSFASCAKGCAAKYAADAMRKQGVESAVVSLGGNVQTLGVKPDGSNWTVGITDPNNSGTYLGTVSVGETAIVTSGKYQRYMPSNPKYHHIFNPKTGYPTTNGLSSVTIICEDGTLADCLSTAMFVSGKTAAIKYWREYGGFDMVLITEDGDITCTIGLLEKFTLINPNYTLSYVE